jgi:hypothetical protein
MKAKLKFFLCAGVCALLAAGCRPDRNEGRESEPVSGLMRPEVLTHGAQLLPGTTKQELAPLPDEGGEYQAVPQAGEEPGEDIGAENQDPEGKEPADEAETAPAKAKAMEKAKEKK